jgi:ABC-type uncharacterized transport system permease subunit
MDSEFLLSLAAMASLLPAGLARHDDEAPMLPFWLGMAVGIAGPGVWIADNIGGGWRTGLASSLWVAVFASMLLFAGLVRLERAAMRLTPLLVSYLLALATLATIWLHAPERALLGSAPEAWLVSHILMAVGAYGLLTLAAVAGFGVFLQERALKRKRPTEFTRRLPSVATGERLLVSLLMASGAVLAFALVSGATVSWFGQGRLMAIDHKTMLSLATFFAIGGLVFLHYRGGLSGRRAARYVLFAYLLLTLAYPGVKFVTDILVG